MASHETSARPPVGEVLASTKLEVPALRAGLVPRDWLVGTLIGNPDARLTLVSAPAGSGKTTLVTQWLASAAEERRFAWLALDPEDGDPVRFWDCVVASLGRVRPGLGARAQAALRAPRTSITMVVLPLLINELADLPEPIVLVLDDLHAIGDPAVHRSLAFLIDRAPATLHLAITTRTDPPLPLARLRARRQLVEVRGTDLRFSDEEARAMLEGLGLALGSGEVAELQLRTEGWAAGLQLAGLSLRGRPAGAERMAAVRREAPQIAEYLTEEVLGVQTPQTREFLLRTSVLDRMTGDLCDAVAQTSGSADRLDALDAANLFVVPLDPAREWYRYHHLFRDALRRRLQRDEGDLAAGLHRRAADWYAAHGLPAEAIGHAFAGDVALAADLVAGQWAEFFNRGELTTVSAWLARLPAEIVDADARLWLARAWIALDTGRLDDISPMLRTAEAIGTPEHLTWASLLRGVGAFKSGDLAGAAAAVARAREIVHHPSRFWRAVAAVVAGATAYWLGRDAQRELDEALATARADGNRLAEVYALGYLSLVAGEDGDRPTAARRLAEGEALLEDPALDEHFVAMAVHLARAAEDERHGAIEASLAAAGRALELARRGAGAIEVAEALRAVAHAQLRAGHAVDARRALHEARSIAAGCPDPGRLAARLHEAAPAIEDDAGDALREPLSDRELAVLRLLATELSQREIGGELYVSLNTVKTHVKNIFLKLRVGSREEAVGRARELGVL
jgi:LuxR family maltose regulon positive regulatory protein